MHNVMGYISSDVQSLRSQATYTSGLPMFNTLGPFGPGAARGLNGTKRSQYSYASSIVSQDAGPSVADTGSVVGGGGGGGSMLSLGVGGGSSADKGHTCSYVKLYDFTLLFMILQLEYGVNKGSLVRPRLVDQVKAHVYHLNDKLPL